MKVSVSVEIVLLYVLDLGGACSKDQVRLSCRSGDDSGAAVCAAVLLLVGGWPPILTPRGQPSGKVKRRGRMRQLIAVSRRYRLSRAKNNSGR
jgi:hypothetical protein